MTEEEARAEFNELLNQDVMYSKWNSKHFQRIKKFGIENAFYEWCSLYSDTKHIRRNNGRDIS